MNEINIGDWVKIVKVEPNDYYEEYCKYFDKIAQVKKIVNTDTFTKGYILQNNIDNLYNIAWEEYEIVKVCPTKLNNVMEI